jgi:hypothetical protein
MVKGRQTSYLSLVDLIRQGINHISDTWVEAFERQQSIFIGFDDFELCAC